MHYNSKSRLSKIHVPSTNYALPMKLTNDSYVILIGTKNFTERYYRDKDGWLKVSARGRKFRMTAEQVLNHLLPAVAGLKPNLILKVEHHATAPTQEEPRQTPSPKPRRGEISAPSDPIPPLRG